MDFRIPGLPQCPSSAEARTDGARGLWEAGSKEPFEPAESQLFFEKRLGTTRQALS